MLWVEYPIGIVFSVHSQKCQVAYLPTGTGFSKGKVTARNEVETAEDFVGFFKNWQKLFGIKNYKIYITVFLTPAVAG